MCSKLIRAMKHTLSVACMHAVWEDNNRPEEAIEANDISNATQMRAHCHIKCIFPAFQRARGLFKSLAIVQEGLLREQSAQFSVPDKYHL